MHASPAVAGRHEGSSESKAHLRPQADVAGGQWMELIIGDQGPIIELHDGLAAAQPRLIRQLGSGQANTCLSAVSAPSETLPGHVNPDGMQ